MLHRSSGSPQAPRRSLALLSLGMPPTEGTAHHRLPRFIKQAGHAADQAASTIRSAAARSTDTSWLTPFSAMVTP